MMLRVALIRVSRSMPAVYQVTSYGEHAALNYWFHPPDRAAFERPYSAERYWAEEWRRSCA
eukprot:6203219-Pleurochrysis_carterae.AAC.1